MPTFFAYSRNEKSALSRSLAQRRFDHVSANEACGSVARREQPGKALLGKSGREIHEKPAVGSGE
jgi:hypothetical protein